MPRPLVVLSVVACLVGFSGAVAGSAAGSTPTPSPSPSGSPSPSASASPQAGAAVGASLPAGDAIDAQLAQALLEQQQLDAVKTQLAMEISVAQGEQKHLSELVASNQKQIDTTIAMINVEQRHLADATTRAADAHAKAVDARHQADADRAQLAEVARMEYMQSDGGFVNWMLSAGTLSDFFDRIARARQIVDGGRDLVTHLHEEEVVASVEQAEAAMQEEQARQAATALAAQQTALQDETAKEQGLIGQLDTQTASAARELANVDRQTSDVAQQVANLRIAQLDRIIADAEQAVWDDAQVYLQHNLGNVPDAPPNQYQGYSGYTGAGTGPNQGPPPSGGRPLAMPTIGASVSQTYGPSANSFEPPAFGYPHFHTGIDFAAPMGTKIYAAAGGIVVSASPGSTGYGNHIVIATDRHLMSLYGHLASMLVKVGDNVQQGQLIGLMGSTGNSTGPHLHFEVRIDNVPVNPAPMLSEPARQG